MSVLFYGNYIVISRPNYARRTLALGFPMPPSLGTMTVTGFITNNSI